MACRGCQVACKQWRDLPAEETQNNGSYQNPGDLSFSTYKLVRMSEAIIDGKINWLFFPDQCRHCMVAPCQDTAKDADAIFTDAATGAVIYTSYTKGLDADEIVEACPYNIPRKAADGTLAKCDMCLNRVRNGLAPACVKTCPTGAMNFGDRKDMSDLAVQRLKEVKQKTPQAALLDMVDVRVIYLVAYDAKFYHEFAVASNATFDVNRAMALKRKTRPIARMASRLV